MAYANTLVLFPSHLRSNYDALLRITGDHDGRRDFEQGRSVFERCNEHLSTIIATPSVQQTGRVKQACASIAEGKEVSVAAAQPLSIAQVSKITTKKDRNMVSSVF